MHRRFSRPFPQLPVIFAVLSGLVWSVQATDSKRLEPGDTVYAACPQAEFRIGEENCVYLDENAKIRVVAVNEGQIQGLTDDMLSGWIPAEKVYKRDDASCVASLKEFDEIQLFTDRFGAILRIDAKDSHFGGDALELLEGLYSLESLELSGSRITNDDLHHLKRLSNLRWLYLDRTSVNDDGLLSLRHLKNLEVLVLSQSSVRGPGLAHLHNLKKLRVLNLSDCPVNDDALIHLTGFDQVQTLALENAPIRGHGLAHLKSMARLNVLNLSGCSLGPGSLLHLRDAGDLRIVRARETPVSTEDRDAMKSANPRLAMFF